MEFQIGQKVRLKPQFELLKEKDRGKYFTIIQIMKTFLVVKWQESIRTLRKDQVDIVSVHIELERLEAAFYEYYEELYCDIPTDDSKIEQKVNELMRVVKSVSINE